MLNKKLFLLDMDGTIYIDSKLFPGSLDFIDFLIEKKYGYIFITNNSSKSVLDYVKKVNSLGIKATAENFLTSSQASAFYLKDKYNKIYVMGTASLKAELSNLGLDITDKYSEDIDCLLVGYDTELHFGKLEDACRLLTKGVAFYGTNADVVCPVSFGYVPDCASVCGMLTAATKKIPQFIGKPAPTMINLAISKTEYSKDQVLLVGDRMYTDIKSGINAGVSTALVLSGETKEEELEQYDFKPDYIFESIKDLHSILTTN